MSEDNNFVNEQSNRHDSPSAINEENVMRLEKEASVVAETDERADTTDANQVTVTDDADVALTASTRRGKDRGQHIRQFEPDDPVEKPKEAPKAELQTEADAPVSSMCCFYPNVEPPRSKIQSYNYLADVPGGYADSEYVEVSFKNTRKGFYKNSTDLPLEIGEWVAVEATPGHDIGRVSMVGALVKLQMIKAGVKNSNDLKRVFRKARQVDMEKFEEAKARENATMIRSRKIAESLGLNMKIGDVEYQGDGNKAIFYYIADERVDFRQLIKVLAETFKVRIEMKQIGARQEAGRIGGIGPCGRPLCCSSWMANFVSVATSAARYQDISLNPQKLAGQCAKLKCCLNFEVDAYVECIKRMPPKETRLETADATYYHFKVDVFKREITYSTDKSIAANLVTIDAERAFEVIHMNKAGEKPLSLKREGEEEPKGKRYNDILDQDNLNRFDNKKRKKKSHRTATQNSLSDKDSKGPVDKQSAKTDRSKTEKAVAVRSDASIAQKSDTTKVGRDNNDSRERNHNSQKRDNKRRNDRYQRNNRPPRDNNRSQQNIDKNDQQDG